MTNNACFVKDAYVRVREDQRSMLPPYLRDIAPGRLGLISKTETRNSGLWVRITFQPVKGARKAEAELMNPSRLYEVVTDPAAIAAHKVSHEEYFAERRATKESQQQG